MACANLNHFSIKHRLNAAARHQQRISGRWRVCRIERRQRKAHQWRLKRDIFSSGAPAKLSKTTGEGMWRR